MSAAYDNQGKILCREVIANIINSVLGSDVSLVELLGTGVGAEYYAEECEITRLCLIEQDKKLYRDYLREGGGFDRLKRDNLKIQIYNCDIESFTECVNKDTWDVVNLDLCQPFYVSESKCSPVHKIKNIFEKNVIENNGLLFTNFQVTGRGVNAIPRWGYSPLKTGKEIKSVIEDIAKSCGLKLFEVHNVRYKSSISSTMHCFCFQVSKQ